MLAQLQTAVPALRGIPGIVAQFHEPYTFRIRAKGRWADTVTQRPALTRWVWGFYSQEWAYLDPQKRDAWNHYAAATAVTTRRGGGQYIAGYRMFMRNVTLYADSAQPRTNPHNAPSGQEFDPGRVSDIEYFAEFAYVWLTGDGLDRWGSEDYSLGVITYTPRPARPPHVGAREVPEPYEIVPPSVDGPTSNRRNLPVLYTAVPIDPGHHISNPHVFVVPPVFKLGQLVDVTIRAILPDFSTSYRSTTTLRIHRP